MKARILNIHKNILFLNRGRNLKISEVVHSLLYAFLASLKAITDSCPECRGSTQKQRKQLNNISSSALAVRRKRWRSCMKCLLLSEKYTQGLLLALFFSMFRIGHPYFQFPLARNGFAPYDVLCNFRKTQTKIKLRKGKFFCSDLGQVFGGNITLYSHGTR